MEHMINDAIRKEPFLILVKSALLITFKVREHGLDLPNKDWFQLQLLNVLGVGTTSSFYVFLIDE